MSRDEAVVHPWIRCPLLSERRRRCTVESLVGFGTIFLSCTLGIVGSFVVLWVLVNVAGGGRGLS